MEQREVVRQRILTLDGLLADPNGPFGQAAGPLADKLAGGWRSERRLLRRIIDETKGDDVHGTLERWYERTAAFADGSEDEAPSWRDRDGHVWHAREVLRLLDDFRRRLAAWIDEEGGSGPDVVAKTAAPTPGAATAGRTGPEQGTAPASADSLADELDEEDEALRQAMLEEEEDDSDEDERYQSVLDPGSR